MSFEERTVFLLKGLLAVMLLLAGDIFAHGVVQEGFAVLGAKDEMDVQPREGLWHGLARPFRALMSW